jgi:PhnB protein
MTTPSDEYHTLTAVFCVKGADAFIAFCKEALGAHERMRRPAPDGSVMHADLAIGDTIFWVTDAIKDPPTSSASACFVNDCDAVFEKAVRMGAKPVFPPMDTAWGTRWARIVDPWGNQWTFTTRMPAPGTS